MASSKSEEDKIAGFAIDRDDMDMLLTKWFGGSYLDIIGWKDYYKKWENRSNGAWLTHEEYNELKEKAKKWNSLEKIDDDWKDGMIGIGKSDDTISWRGPTKKFEDMQEKAKNYDEYIAGGRFGETIEKAKKWDSMENTTLVEKAKKYDEFSRMSGSELREKAKKYDEFNSTYGYDLTLMKAKKWDELKRILDPS